MREVAQGPAGQAAFLRRPHALSEGGGGSQGDGQADGGDRQGHTGLADRISQIALSLICIGMIIGDRESV